MATYDSIILADSPKLYWDLDEASGTAIADGSGNGNTGKVFTNQSVGATGIVQGFAPLVANDDGRSIFVRGNWSSGGTVQDYPGTGFRADAYKPYVVGSKRSFECWLTKTEDESFATIFSGSGAGAGGEPSSTTSPHPTWEMGADGMMRFYPNVETFPIGWVDWGNSNTGFPYSSFALNVATHIVCTYDDSAGVAEWFINGVSMGRQGPTGYAGGALAYNAVRDPGLFQVGWRGNFTTPNAEVYGGFIDKVAVYEYILTPEQIARHYRAGLAFYPPAGRIARKEVRSVLGALGPSLWLPLDGVYGTRDVSASAHTTSPSGGIDVGAGAAIVDNSAAVSADFDGVADYIDVTSFSPFSHNGGWSFLGVTQIDAGSGDANTLFGSSGAAGVNNRVSVNDSTGVISVRINGTSVNHSTVWPSFTRPVSWCVVLLEITSIATSTLYIDGKLADVQVIGAGYNASPGNLQVGANGSTFSSVLNPLDGRMSHFAAVSGIVDARHLAAFHKAVRSGVIG